ncbi:MAG: CpsB/CapC family capsule biosynthesis tyrosine phosphatase [Polyangiaceae bacterium]
MRGYIDLHSHWIPGIDDGVQSAEDGLDLLERLAGVGFSVVVATPHMRPGMFDNERRELIDAFERMVPLVAERARTRPMPRVLLSSEHHFEETVYGRLMHGQGIPYPPLSGALRGKPSVLIEFAQATFPSKAQARMFDLARAGLRPVLAHPERYRPVWSDDACLDPLIDAGVCLLLDICSVVGKYGRASQEAAEKLVLEGAYEAACSDAHRPDDVADVALAMKRLEELVGREETDRLLREGPTGILG